MGRFTAPEVTPQEQRAVLAWLRDGRDRRPAPTDKQRERNRRFHGLVRAARQQRRAS